MALQSDRSIPSEETYNMLRERAAKDGDVFSVKVLRRNHMGQLPELVASLSGAMVEHFSTPELWIPPLCGGGNYSLQAYHSTDMSKPVGGYLQFKVSQDSKEIDATILKRPDWRGPAVLDFPQKEAPRERDGSIYDMSPPGPSAGLQRHQNTQYPAGVPGGGFTHRPEYVAEGNWQERQRLQGALEGERRKLEEERLANEREKHRQELEALKKSHDADMRSFKAEIMSELRSKPTGPDPSAVMLETMLRMQAENAKQAAEDRREREKIAADDRRAAEARQTANDERFNRLLEKMADRPKEDPLAIIEKVTGLLGKNNNAEAQMKMMANMAEMHSVQIGTAMDFIQASADLQLGAREKEDSPVAKAIEAGLKGIGALARGSAAQRQQPQQFAQPQVPQTFEQKALAQPAQPAPAPAPAQAAPAPAPTKPAPTILEQIEFGIMGKAPVSTVAKAIVNHIKDPSITAALVEVGMDFEVLIQNRLGIWAKQHVDNEAYLKALMEEVEKELKAAGYIPPDEVAQVEEDAQVEGDEGEETEE